MNLEWILAHTKAVLKQSINLENLFCPLCKTKPERVLKAPINIFELNPYSSIWKFDSKESFICLFGLWHQANWYAVGCQSPTATWEADVHIEGQIDDHCYILDWKLGTLPVLPLNYLIDCFECLQLSLYNWMFQLIIIKFVKSIVLVG